MTLRETPGDPHLLPTRPVSRFTGHVLDGAPRRSTATLRELLTKAEAQQPKRARVGLLAWLRWRRV